MPGVEGAREVLSWNGRLRFLKPYDIPSQVDPRRCMNKRPQSGISYRFASGGRRHLQQPRGDVGSLCLRETKSGQHWSVPS